MYAHRDRPQDAISLYSSGGNTFDVRLSGDGSIDHQPIGRDRAYRDYHEGATVLHQGEQYQVVELREDIPQPYISLEKANVSYYTQSQGQVNIYDTVVEDSREVGPFTLNWGYGTVSVHYSTYLKREIGSGDVLELGNETGVPPLEMRTQLCWAETPNNIEQAMLNKHSEYHNPECINLPPRLHGYLGGIHAVEHAMIAVSPLELKVDGGDIGGLATNRLPGNPEKSGWFIYDGIEGGLGSQGRFTNTSKTSPSVPTISSLIVRVAVTKGVPPVRWTTAAETTTAHCTLLQLRTSSSICSVIRRRMTSTNTSQRQIAK